MEQPNLVERVERLEKQVQNLFSLVQPPVPIEPAEREIEPVESGDTGWVSQSAARVAATQKAQTDQAIPLPANFSPSVVGYTLNDFAADFPSLSPSQVMDSFLSHHRSKGDVSKNWMEKFFSYSANAVRMQAERKAQMKQGERETDSMGLPLDRAARIHAKRYEEEHYRMMRETEKGTPE